MPRISKRVNLLKDFEAVAKSCPIKAYIHFCLDEEDSFEDEINDYVAAKLAVFKSSRYVFCCPYQTWNSNWE